MMLSLMGHVTSCQTRPSAGFNMSFQVVMAHGLDIGHRHFFSQCEGGWKHIYMVVILYDTTGHLDDGKDPDGVVYAIP